MHGYYPQTKHKCKCRKCGQPYLLYKQDMPVPGTQHSIYTVFTIADLNDKHIRHGIAVSHC